MFKVIDGVSAPTMAACPMASRGRGSTRSCVRVAAALQAEVAAYVAQFANQVDEDGHRLVVA
jgi:hypothetical protein